MRIVGIIAGIILLVGVGVGLRFFLGNDMPQPMPSDQDPVEVPVPSLDGDGNGLVPNQPSDGDDLMSEGSSGDVPQDLAQPTNPAQQPSAQLPITGSAIDENGPLRLSLPIDCTLLDDCLVFSHPNVGTDFEPVDYRCGALTTPEEDGTEFRLIDHTVMEQGVAAIAAAPGTVTRVQDGIPDANFRLFGTEAASKNAFGNLVVIEHADGTLTRYEHLRRGSIIVKEGDQVVRGQALGFVGMSGLTEHPVLGFTVLQQGFAIDPFDGGSLGTGCNLGIGSLWTDNAAASLSYPRTMIMRTGFADLIMNRPAVEYALFEQTMVASSADALVLHVYLLGVQEGDSFIAEILAPDGTRFVKSARTFTSHRQIEMLAIGRDGLTEPLTPGIYEGIFEYYREGESPDAPILVFETRSTVTVE